MYTLVSSPFPSCVYFFFCWPFQLICLSRHCLQFDFDLVIGVVCFVLVHLNTLVQLPLHCPCLHICIMLPAKRVTVLWAFITKYLRAYWQYVDHEDQNWSSYLRGTSGHLSVHCMLYSWSPHLVLFRVRVCLFPPFKSTPLSQACQNIWTPLSRAFHGLFLPWRAWRPP